MKGPYIPTIKKRRDFLRNVFFNDLEEERKKVLGDWILVQWYHGKYKKWVVSVYSRESYMRQFPDELKRKIRIERVKIIPNGVEEID